MKGGRKNLKRAIGQESVTLVDGQSIMQVVSLRGSNIIEVMDANSEKSLALFPAKFQKSMWVKRGSFVVVNDSGRKEALEAGSKVACIVSQVLFHEQVRQLKKSLKWPEAFNSATTSIEHSAVNNKEESTAKQVEHEGRSSDDDDDGLPPLEMNTNRTRPSELHSDSDSDSVSDS